MIPIDEHHSLTPEQRAEEWKQGVRAVFAGYVASTSASTSIAQHDPSEVATDPAESTSTSTTAMTTMTAPISMQTHTQTEIQTAREPVAKRELATIRSFWTRNDQVKLIRPTLRSLAPRFDSPLETYSNGKDRPTVSTLARRYTEVAKHGDEDGVGTVADKSNEEGLQRVLYAILMTGDKVSENLPVPATYQIRRS